MEYQIRKCNVRICHLNFIFIFVKELWERAKNLIPSVWSKLKWSTAKNCFNNKSTNFVETVFRPEVIYQKTTFCNNNIVNYFKFSKLEKLGANIMWHSNIASITNQSRYNAQSCIMIFKFKHPLFKLMGAKSNCKTPKKHLK